MPEPSLEDGGSLPSLMERIDSLPEPSPCQRRPSGKDGVQSRAVPRKEVVPFRLDCAVPVPCLLHWRSFPEAFWHGSGARSNPMSVAVPVP